MTTLRHATTFLSVLALTTACAAVSAGAAEPAETVTRIFAATPAGDGKDLGTIRARAAQAPAVGVVFTADLAGLAPGMHGFHMHENPTCAPAANKDGQMVAALAAGGHYDPDKTGKHEGPDGHGHLGDLPYLSVGADGVSKASVSAPRLTMDHLAGRSLMIHAGGDNYSDQPAALGGGGARMACGVIGR